MEEPLGSRFGNRFHAFIALAVLTLSVCAAPAFADSADADMAPERARCHDLLRDEIALTIEHVSESRPQNTAKARQILHGLSDEIEKRVRLACPDATPCTGDQLSETILRITHEVLDENPPKNFRWRSKLIFGGSLSLYLGLSVWVTMNTTSMAAAAASSLLTVIGAMVLIKVGGPNLEGPLAKLGRSTVAADGGQEHSLRGHRQQRHEQIYWLTQGSVDTVEESGRYTERQVVLQLCNAKNACVPYPWDTPESYRERAAMLVAKTLSDLMPTYLELDLSEPFYATWVRSLFSQWHLDDSTREAFRTQVLEFLQTFYDGDAVEGSELRQRYERVLRSWTAPLQPLILRRGNHQSRTAPPSRKAANPSLEWLLEGPSPLAA